MALPSYFSVYQQTKSYLTQAALRHPCVFGVGAGFGLTMLGSLCFAFLAGPFALSYLANQLFTFPR